MSELKVIKREIENIKSIIKDDTFAISFQSMAQYRKALLEIINV